jgi:radical SAM enzyme (TIGR01210 family)
MSILAPLCQQLKGQFIPKSRSLKESAHYWTEKDRLNNTIAEAFVIILRTQGCTWAHASGCSMCGYFTDSYWNATTDHQIETQFQTAMQRYQNEPIIKIFNSGSFFDPKEIPPRLQKKILTTINKTTKKIVVESRPEYITNHAVNSLQKDISPSKIEVGIGLESANDLIRTHAINKGFLFKDYQKAAAILKKRDIGIKTYLLIKPPLLTEYEAIQDTLETIQKIKDISTTISFNPCNVQRHTAVEYLWRRHNYRPPWLWSIIDILKKSSQLTSGRLQCDIVGGGSKRGAHNCPNCNSTCLNAIRQFSLTQNKQNLSKLECDCKTIWEVQLTNENQTYGSINDYQRQI